MGNKETSKGILLFLVLLISLAAIVFLGTEIFQVKKLTVYCSGELDKDVIINLSGVSRGDNIFKISREKVKNRIEGNSPFPIVETISFRLPDEVIIAVEERTPAALIPYLSSHIVIDTSGFILDIIKQRDTTQYPIIEGIRLRNLTKGSFLQSVDSDNYKQKVLIHLLEAICEWDIGSMLEQISLEDPDSIILLTRDGVTVSVGQAVELDKKLGWLKSEAYVEVLGRTEKGILDVSVPGKAVYRTISAEDDQPDEISQSDEAEESETFNN